MLRLLANHDVRTGNLRAQGRQRTAGSRMLDMGHGQVKLEATLKLGQVLISPQPSQTLAQLALDD
ncbi:hypothetical protein D3C87_1767510 [compost metagenome]